MNDSCLVTKRKTHRITEELLCETVSSIKSLAQSLSTTETIVVTTMLMLEIRRANELANSDNDQTDKQVYEVGQALEKIVESIEAIAQMLVAKQKV